MSLSSTAQNTEQRYLPAELEIPGPVGFHRHLWLRALVLRHCCAPSLSATTDVGELCSVVDAGTHDGPRDSRGLSHCAATGRSGRGSLLLRARAYLRVLASEIQLDAQRFFKLGAPEFHGCLLSKPFRGCCRCESRWEKIDPWQAPAGQGASPCSTFHSLAPLHAIRDAYPTAMPSQRARERPVESLDSAAGHRPEAGISSVSSPGQADAQ